MKSYDVSCVIVSFESAPCLRACIRALPECVGDVIVVDNASRDASCRSAADLGARVLSNDRNEGYGRAANRGIAAAATEFVLLLNPDIVLDAHAIPLLIEAAKRYPEAAVLAPRLIEPGGRVFFQPRSLLSRFLQNPAGLLSLPEGDVCTPFLSGAALLIRRDAFLKVGGFDTDIFLFYEDDDLCRRLSDAGYALVHVHDAIARHGRGRSSAPQRGRIFNSRWHQAWSRAYVSRKYGLPNPAWRMATVNGVKALAACLTGRRALIERYAGSACGAVAFLRGKTALEREGLVPPSPFEQPG